jgi:NADH-quinone oxidoreductase subunit K
MSLQAVLLVSCVVFTLGLVAALTHTHAVRILIGVELMLGAANLNFIAFWRFGENPDALVGVVTVLFAIAVAAAEAALGLAVILMVRRRCRVVDVDRVKELNG